MKSVPLTAAAVPAIKAAIKAGRPLSQAASTEPITAKPTVEPIARCALMIPDAIPARSGGTDVIATVVIGVRHSA